MLQTWLGELDMYYMLKDSPRVSRKRLKDKNRKSELDAELRISEQPSPRRRDFASFFKRKIDAAHSSRKNRVQGCPGHGTENFPPRSSVLNDPGRGCDGVKCNELNPLLSLPSLLHPRFTTLPPFDDHPFLAQHGQPNSSSTPSSDPNFETTSSDAFLVDLSSPPSVRCAHPTLPFLPSNNKPRATAATNGQQTRYRSISVPWKV